MKMSTETFVLEAFGGKGKFKTKETNVALLKYYNSALWRSKTKYIKYSIL